MAKDWTGNSRSSHATLGARNYALNEREENDFYATEPKALELLLERETFNKDIWECACGDGHLAKVLESHGYNVRATDLVQRNYGRGGYDFLEISTVWKGDILTNPPYKYAQEFVEKSMEIIEDGNRVAMFLKIQFLEGKARRKMFEKYPPKLIYVSSSRLHCALNGEFEKYSKSSPICYAWYIWEKGFTGEPTIRWFN